jgi:hypothetical protein
MRPRLTVVATGALLVMLGALPGAAQPPGPPGAGAEPAKSARDAAPVDLTGYWVSLVTEDWIERMSPDSPPSGTGGGFGRRGGGAQPAPDLPVSNPDEPCRVYGAGGSLRVPGRLHITWLDDDTLGIEMDAGSQRRVLNFDTALARADEPSLQGYSVAAWETPEPRRGFRGGGPAAEPPAWGSLRVVTTNMTGGYLLSSRSNYTADAVLTEHFTRHSDFGQEYFTVTAVLEDKGGTRITSSTFKKEPNGSKFSPTGCEIVR